MGTQGRNLGAEMEAVAWWGELVAHWPGPEAFLNLLSYTTQDHLSGVWGWHGSQQSELFHIDH